jgi:hypothetical protein
LRGQGYCESGVPAGLARVPGDEPRHLVKKAPNVRRDRRDRCRQEVERRRFARFLTDGAARHAVPFKAIQASQKNGSWYLTMNATTDALKNAPGYKYDKGAASWVPA